jgi:hypothetical protein
MDVKRELEEMEAKLRTTFPKIAAERPEFISRMAAITLADDYDREGLPACVPCPVCGETIRVEKFPGSAWIGCKKGCTLAHFNYGSSESNDPPDP